MKNYLKIARVIILLPVISIALQANQSKTLSYSYDKNRDAIYPHIVTIKGKNSSCHVRFAISHVTPYDTDCIEKKNSKGAVIFSPKDKSIYKTLAEVSYFKVTKRELKEKKSKKIPFVGGGGFNFLGGSGTRETVEIFANKKVVYKFYGIFDSTITWQGKYSSPKNPYWVEDDVICTYSPKSGLLAGICTELSRGK